MANPRHFWNDVWVIILLIGIIIGFIGGHYYRSSSHNTNQSSNPNKPAVASVNPDQPKILPLSKGQILSIAKKNSNKICVIGIDGATWHIILPMVNSGKLPNLSKLMDNGTYGNLSSLSVSMSPVIWTSIATGKNPEQHGIEGFIVKLPNGYERIPVTSDMRKVKAIWNILSEFEKKVGVISWWVTRPPEKVNGFMVSDGFRMHRFTYPDEIFKEYESKLESPDKWFAQQSNFYTSYKYDPDFKKKYDLDSPEYFHQYIMQYLHDFSLKDYYSMTAAKSLYPENKPDFFSIYFPSVDALSHFAWKYMEPKSINEDFDVTPQEQKEFGQLIPKIYEKVDQYIGEIVKMLPPDTIVMVISDHGFEARTPALFFHWITLNKLFNEIGLISYTPQHDMDWAKTTAYELEDLSRPERVLYLNLKGREPKGIIDPKDYEKVRQSVRYQLIALKTVDGKPIFNEVKLPPPSKQFIDSTAFQYMTDYYYGGVANYTGDIYAMLNPDLQKEDYLVRGDKKIPLTEFITPHPQTGDHNINGIIALSGGPIKKKSILKDASVLDVTPTILYLMGLPTPQDMPGKVLESAISSQYLKDHPILRIPTYETEQWKPPKAIRNPAEEKEYMDSLSGIGYFNPNGRDTTSQSPKKK